MFELRTVHTSRREETVRLQFIRDTRSWRSRK
jgi:hypothetical protein